MKARSSDQTIFENVVSGFTDGCNSVKIPWLLSDTQYRWGVNIVNRGGILQTRPGYRMRLRLPAGLLQGGCYFRASKSNARYRNYLMFAVSGKVYAIQFPLVQPSDWEPYRIKSISFSPTAKRIYWEQCEKSASSATTGDITIVPTYSIMMMQDGISPAAYFDGDLSGHTDQSAPALQTPTGTWMKWSGNRLWLARGNIAIAGDLGDPLSFKERVQSGGAGDFKMTSDITGFTNMMGENQTSDLLVFTDENTSRLRSSVLDRDTWQSIAGFQTLLLPNVGTVSGRSIVNHKGFIWFYSYGGLIGLDSTSISLFSSEIRYKDVEMGWSKRNLADDLSMICGGAFEQYLLMSVPSGDTLNAHTQVLDFSVANELNRKSEAAWNGIWTGTRPVEWINARVDGIERIFHCSVDYQSIDGDSFNHVWEAFQPDRMDSYVLRDEFNVEQLIQNPIYCSIETKMLGNGLDYKRMKYIEADLIEIGGTVNIRMSYIGSKGGYNEIMRKKIIATLDASQTENEAVHRLYDRVGPFHVQSRRVRSEEAKIPTGFNVNVESKFPPNIDKWFGVKIEWCGRMGVEAIRMITEPLAETETGICEENESGSNILTDDGTTFHFSE